MKAGVSLMQSTIYDYFAQNYKKLEAKITAIEQNTKSIQKNQLKIALKRLKTQTTNQIEIKYVCKILRSRHKKVEQEDIDLATPKIFGNIAKTHSNHKVMLSSQISVNHLL